MFMDTGAMYQPMSQGADPPPNAPPTVGGSGGIPMPDEGAGGGQPGHAYNAPQPWESPYGAFMDRWYQQDWRPVDFPGEDDFYGAITSREDPLNQQAWRDYTTALTNAILPYMSAEDARFYSGQLSDYSRQFGQYDDPQMSGEFDTWEDMARQHADVGGGNARDADRQMYLPNRWDAIWEGLTFANQNLFGEAAADWDQDATGIGETTEDSPLRTANEWLKSLRPISQQYGSIQEGQPDISRWQWRELGERWQDKQREAQNLGINPDIVELGRTMLLPERTYGAISPVQFSLSGGGRPSTGARGSQWAYRNPQYL